MNLLHQTELDKGNIQVVEAGVGSGGGSRNLVNYPYRK
jgi:hypothetical protein